MLTITLRQEIINGQGESVKELQCNSALSGRPDTQMYDVWLSKESKRPEVRINRNNILSIVETDSNDTDKTDY